MTRAHPRSPRSLVARATRLATVTIATFAVAAFTCAGCSFKLVRPSPVRADWPEQVTPHSSQAKCTRSPAPPLLDTGVALTFGTLSYIERNSGSSSFTPVAGLAAVPFAASAIYGFWMTSRCRDYQGLFTDQGPQN